MRKRCLQPTWLPHANSLVITQTVARNMCILRRGATI
jgi:hypothetical protein